MAVSYGTYTITEVQEGSQIWTSSATPTTPDYTFDVSYLTGDSDIPIREGDIILNSYYRYTVLSISSDGTTVLTGNRESIRGETGAASVTYSLIVSNLAIIKDKNGNLSPSSITVTAKSQTGSDAMKNYIGRIKIETTTNNSTWTTRINEDVSTKTYTIPTDIVAIRCSLYLNGGTTTLLDQQTIPIVSDGIDGNDGNDGKDAYGVVLTNENHTFAGNSTSALASEIECNVIAYKGTTQVASTIGTITGQPSGMTTSLLNNGTVNSAFKVIVTTSMVTRNGILNIPITVDGKTFTKKFTYSLALKGSVGTSENLLMDVYASSLTKVDAPWDRYLSDTGNSSITGEFIAEENLPDPNATHFYRITDSSASTYGRGYCFYNNGTPPFLEGNTYRIGCWVRSHSGEPQISFILGGSLGSWLVKRKVSNTEWEWVEAVHTFGNSNAIDGTPVASYKRLYFYFYNNNVENTSLDMCGFRLERVNVDNGTARNILRKTETLDGWTTTNGATISNGIVTFPTSTSDVFRGLKYPSRNINYSIVRNKYCIISMKVKANIGERCCVNVESGFTNTETNNLLQKYKTQYIYFIGTGEWQTICASELLTDYSFTSGSGSGTIDFDNCWFRINLYAQKEYHNSFELKEPQLCLGTTATSWTPAPEDIEEEVSNLRTDLQTQIDEKIQTYYQATAPSWSGATDRVKHNGDLWYCTESDSYTGYEAKNVYRYDSASNTWVEYSATSELFDAVDGKSTIFYGTTSDTFTDVDTGDYLVNSVDGSSYRWDGTQWVKVTDYQTAINNIEIGGRNLLKGSNVTNTSLTTRLLGGTSTQTIPSGTVITLSVQIDADDVVWESSGNRRIGVASSIVKDGGGNQYIEAWAAMTGSTANRIDKTFDTSFHGRVKGTYTLQGELPLDKAFNLHIQNVASGTVKVSRPKLEIGNKATDWTPAPEDISEAIDNINAIGVNLIPLSENLKSFTIENSTRTTVTYTDDSCTIVNTYGNTKYGIYYNVDVEPNSTYTLSFQASNVSGTNVNYSVGNRTPDQTASWTDITNGYKDIVDGKNVCTFTIPNTVTVVRIYICIGTLNGTATISNLKLEIGEKATDWIPASKDVQDARKVATNYLSADTTGIMIADMNDGYQTPRSATGKNVFIDSESVNIRNGQNVLSSFGDDLVVLGQLGKPRLELSSTSISSISEIGVKNFNIISGSSEKEKTITKNGTFENTSSETDKFSGSFTISDEFYYFHNIVATVSFNYTWDGQTHTSAPLTLNIDDPVEDETQTAWYIGEEEYLSSYSLNKEMRCTVQHNANMTFLYFDYSAQIKPQTTSVSYQIGNDALYSVVIETKTYQNTSYTFGSRVINAEHGANSFAIGEGLVASSNNQIAVGRYNDDDSEKNYAFMVGNGIYGESRSNAFAVDWNGHTEMGDINGYGLQLLENSQSEMDNYIECIDVNDDTIFSVSKTGAVNSIGRVNASSINLQKENDSPTDYIQCQDENNNVKFNVSNNGDITSTGDADIGGDLSVTGDINPLGNINMSGLIQYNNKPMFKVANKTFKSIGIGSGRSYTAARDIAIDGYKPMSIGGIKLTNNSSYNPSTNADAGWCVIPAFWLDYTTTTDHPNVQSDSIYFYIWNMHSSKSVNVDFYARIVYIATDALGNN